MATSPGEAVGSPTDTPELTLDPGDQPGCRKTPPPTKSPRELLAQPRHWGCCGRTPVTLNGEDEPWTTGHLHPPATSPTTWQEEPWSELGSRRGQSPGHGPRGTAQLPASGSRQRGWCGYAPQGTQSCRVVTDDAWHRFADAVANEDETHWQQHPPQQDPNPPALRVARDSLPNNSCCGKPKSGVKNAHFQMRLLPRVSLPF